MAVATSDLFTGSAIRRHHHITLCVGGAQEDYDFHTKTLGLKNLKKTALYDGNVPIYHLYYGNDMGDESTLVTCFPMRQSGRVARRGTNQAKTLMLSIPGSATSYWHDRLSARGFEVDEHEHFGEKVLAFDHPCGIPYELVAVEGDERAPYSHGEVPTEYAIRGTHGLTVSVRDLDTAAEFAATGWTANFEQEEADRARFSLGAGGSGTIIDYVAEPKLPDAGWTYGEGMIHHTAFQVDNETVQFGIKAYLEGLGFTDVSEQKDRGYFLSVYVRTPTGALFEATVSKPEGFTIDEAFENLGSEFKVPPQFGTVEEVVSQLEPLVW